LVLVSIDFNSFAGPKIAVFEEISGIIISISASFKEFAFHDARVSSWGLVNQETVVIAEELNHELTFLVFWLGVTEFSAETQNDLVVHPLKEVFLRRLGHQAVHISKGILLITKSIIRRDNDVFLIFLLDFSNITG
jgi:hypothetical protein